MNRLRRVSWTSRTVFWLILVGLIGLGLFAFFQSQAGQQTLLVCCGGAALLAMIGLLSERAMRRR